MTQTLLYQTTLSAKARRGLILNLVAALLLMILSGVQWFAGGHWIHGLMFCVVVAVSALLLLILRRSKHPLEVYEDRIVLNSLTRTAVPLASIDGVGTHSKRGTSNLTYRDASGQSGEMLIHWKFIREPQEEVLAQINRALEEMSS